MFEFLEDPNWLDVLIGATALIIGTLLTVILFIKGRRAKKLSYEIITSEPLLKVNNDPNNDDHPEDIKVLYKDIEVKDVHIIVVKLINNGNVPIKESDISWPPALAFGHETKILNFEITEKNPKELPADLRRSGGKRGIVLKKLLLNSDDYVIIKCLLSNYSGEIQPTCRIVGVKEITEYSRRKIPTWVWMIAVFSVILGIQLMVRRRFPDSPSNGGSGVQLEILIIIALVFMVIGLTSGVSIVRTKDRS